MAVEWMVVFRWGVAGVGWTCSTRDDLNAPMEGEHQQMNRRGGDK